MLSLSFLQKFSEFLRLNSQKCCEPVSSLHFWLPNVLRATPRALFRLIPRQCPPHSPLYRAYLSNIPATTLWKKKTVSRLPFRVHSFSSSLLFFPLLHAVAASLRNSEVCTGSWDPGIKQDWDLWNHDPVILWVMRGWNEQGAKGFVHRLVVTGSEVGSRKFRSCQLPNVLVLCFSPPVGFSWLVPTRIASWLGSIQKNPHQKCWARTATGWALPIILSYQYDALHILCKWCMCMCRITLQTSLLPTIYGYLWSLCHWVHRNHFGWYSWQITCFFWLNIEPKWAKSRNPIRLFQRLTCLDCSGNDLSQQNSISVVGGSSCDINMSWLARCLYRCSVVDQP